MEWVGEFELVKLLLGYQGDNSRVVPEHMILGLCVYPLSFPHHTLSTTRECIIY